MWIAHAKLSAEENCQIIYNLTFCSNVNYAVPGRPSSFNHTELGRLYDGNTSALFTNFIYSMEQIPCNASSDARYSLAVTCDDCIAAYKQWLCAVTMPRCAEFSSSASYLQPRNVAQDFINGTNASSITGDPSFSKANQNVMAMNSSRSPWIDTTIRPGPYKEVLPCGSLCFGLVQKCPAAMGFACPDAGKAEYNHSYGPAAMDGDSPMCNLPGSIGNVSVANALRPSLPMGFALVVVAAWSLVP